MKNQHFKHKLLNAWNGIRYAWDQEDNFRAHIFLGAAAFVFFLFVQPVLFWWGLIILCITLILAAELANSAIEALIDHLHPQLHPSIGQVKDMLAGMVLVLSVGAVVIALLALLDTWA